MLNLTTELCLSTKIFTVFLLEASVNRFLLKTRQRHFHLYVPHRLQTYFDWLDSQCSSIAVILIIKLMLDFVTHDNDSLWNSRSRRRPTVTGKCNKQNRTFSIINNLRRSHSTDVSRAWVKSPQFAISSWTVDFPRFTENIENNVKGHSRSSKTKLFDATHLLRFLFVICYSW